MTSYSQVFGGQNVYPSQLTFRNISLAADVTLEWPAEIATTNDVVAWIMRVSPTAGGFSIILDDATLASNGVSLLFYNAGAFTFTLKDSTGGTIASIDAGLGWDIILRDNSTAAGSWLVVQRGAGTSEAQASQLAGAGLVAIGGLLSSSVLVTDRSTDFPITPNASATLFDWTGGAGTATIDATATLGTGWWTIIRNDGSGSLTVVPTSGQIDGAANKVFAPGSAAFVFENGTDLFTVGFGDGGGGTSFDYISINISSASGGNYTLTGAQLNRISYQFTGVLTGNVQVVIPSTVQEYWVTNATTGAFTVAVRTAAQTPPGVLVSQGTSIIGYCNGTIFIQAAGTIATPIPVNQGGTGATTAGGARTNLGSTTIGDALFTATTAAAARTTLILGTLATLNTVAAAQIASDAVTTVKILDANVTTNKIADSNVTTNKIADSNVTTAKINNLAVTTGKVADNAVTFAKMQAITDGKLLGASGGTAVEEITVGTGLTLAANTLSVTSSGTFTSAQQTITAAGTFTVAHGLGAAPKWYGAYLQCITNDIGYTAGDEVQWNFSATNQAGQFGIVLVPDATNIVARYASSAAVFWILRKDTGALASLTLANWAVVVRARL